MFRTLTLSAAAALIAGSVSAADVNGIFIDLAAQDDDRAAVRALSKTGASGPAFSSKGAAVSPLEVALQHALENDDRQLAAHIAKKLGR